MPFQASPLILCVAAVGDGTLASSRPAHSCILTWHLPIPAVPSSLGCSRRPCFQGHSSDHRYLGDALPWTWASHRSHGVGRYRHLTTTTERHAALQPWWRPWPRLCLRGDNGSASALASAYLQDRAPGDNSSVLVRRKVS